MTRAKTGKSRNHVWQPARPIDDIGDTEIIRLDICLHCAAQRRVSYNSAGQERILSTSPARLPEQCVRRR